MTCARVAAEQIDPVHAAECLACRRALVEQRDLVAQLAMLPALSLDRERRQTLAAEVMARADLHDDTRALPRRRTGRYLAGVLAAAALAVVIVREERGLSARVERRAPVVVETAPPVLAPAPAPRPERAPRDPEPASEAPVVEAPAVEAPAPKLDRARQVFGAAAKHRQAEIDREMLVEETPIAAFRAGWEALRTARYADAIAAFDRATDPAVVEDASFWAAIAAHRAGQADDARKRLDLFLATFPDSPRAEDARRAREVLR